MAAALGVSAALGVPPAWPAGLGGGGWFWKPG